MGRVEIFQGRARRRWSEDDKRRLVAETFAPGETVHGVARRRGVSTSQLFTWRKRLRAEAGLPSPPPTVPGFAAVAIAPVPPPSATRAAPRADRGRAGGRRPRPDHGTRRPGGGRGGAPRAGRAVIPFPGGVRVWLATGRTDMRKGMNGLALQVQEVLERDPYAGHLFVFRGRRGDLIKISGTTPKGRACS